MVVPVELASLLFQITIGCGVAAEAAAVVATVCCRRGATSAPATKRLAAVNRAHRILSGPPRLLLLLLLARQIGLDFSQSIAIPLTMAFDTCIWPLKRTLVRAALAGIDAARLLALAGSQTKIEPGIMIPVVSRRAISESARLAQDRWVSCDRCCCRCCRYLLLGCGQQQP